MSVLPHRAEAAEATAAASLEAAPALALQGISKSWRDNEVLREARLELAPGTRGFLGGRNGAGKTTLIRIAAGVIHPDAGSVAIHGLDPERDREAFQSRLGYLPAGNGGLYARLTVRQNLEFWASLGLLTAPQRRGTVQWTLDRFDLRTLEKARCDRISMGQRQRVRLASTFLHSPAVVLLDEPHTSLDDEALALLRGAMADHHERGGTSLWCAPSHTQADLQYDLELVVADGIVRAA